jgi:hypothetical protein
VGPTAKSGVERATVSRSFPLRPWKPWIADGFVGCRGLLRVLSFVRRKKVKVLSALLVFCGHGMASNSVDVFTWHDLIEKKYRQ